MRQLLIGTGLKSRLLRGLLSPLGCAYGMVGRIRAALYRHRLLSSWKAPIPAISVGNLTAGGTGKTPMVLWLVRELILMKERPAILLRGYGHPDPEQADETRLYRLLLPEVPVYANPDRCSSAKQATKAGATVLVLDDGFQHLRLQRDLDIVLVDATCPLGGGWPLPAGLLREFPSALKRAGLILLTRCDQGNADAAEAVIRRFCPDTPLGRTAHKATRLHTLAGKVLELNTLQERKVIALSAIGQPETFADTLRGCGATVCEAMSHPDHHIYTKEDCKKAQNRAEALGATIVTTEKDAVKLQDHGMEESLVLGIEFVPEAPDALLSQVSTLLQEP